MEGRSAGGKYYKQFSRLSVIMYSVQFTVFKMIKVILIPHTNIIMK